ncbi:MAG: secretin N-terminal domain-containing protein [Vampirovibrionales bacterium]
MAPLAWSQVYSSNTTSQSLRSLYQVSLQSLPNQNKLLNMALRGVSVADALSAIGRQGGFAVVVSDSVTGELSTDLNHITLADALRALAAQHNLQYAVRDGRTLQVFNRSSDAGAELQHSHSDIIPLKHANATVLASLLSSSLFANNAGNANTGGMGGGGAGTTPTNTASGKSIQADFHTNSLIVVGAKEDIDLVKDYVSWMDQPRERKTWRLSHADALDVASLLAAGLFNAGTPSFIVGGNNGGGAGGGSGSGGAGGGAGGGGRQNNGMNLLPSTVRARQETLQEGDGGSTASAGSSSGDSSGSSGSSGGSGGSDITLRATIKEQTTVSIAPTGALIVPDTRLNTLTLLGTATQIALAETMMASLDQPAPQVVIETTLLEITEGSTKELGFRFGLDQGTFQSSHNNVQSSTGSYDGTNAFTNIGLPNSADNPFETLFRFATRRDFGSSYNFFYQINMMMRNGRAKILANPNLITMHDQEAIISIVDEIIRSVTVTLDSDTAAVVGTETNIGEVGVKLAILPKIGANGMINMRIHPSLSTVASVQEDAQGNTITLLSRREALGQNIKLRDGETLIMGGLIQETDVSSVSKYPFLADLPILGALARNSSKSRSRSELLVMITPHIVKDDTTAINAGPGVLPGIQPPKVISSSGMGSQGFAYVAQPMMENNIQDADIPDIIANPTLQHPLPMRPTFLAPSPPASQSVSAAPLTGWQKKRYKPQ